LASSREFGYVWWRDSILDIQLENLNPGMNQFLLRITDLAGNRKEELIQVWYEDRSNLLEKSQKKGIIINSNIDQNVKTFDHSEYFVIRYDIRRGETLAEIAQRFYGQIEMYQVLAKFNNLNSRQEHRSIPVGSTILIPIYKNFHFGRFIISEELKRNW
jgi:hypothetical protein